MRAGAGARMTTQIPARSAGEQDDLQAAAAPPTTPPRRRKRGERQNPWGYLFVAPALALYLIFSIWPIFRGFAMAFTDYRFVYPETRWAFNGLANFRAIAADPDFWQSLGVSLRFTALVLPLTTLLALLLAVVIGKVARGAGFYRWMIYLPVILPVAVTYLMFGELYNSRFGLINSVLQGLGVDRPPHWLGSVQTVLPALAASDVWRGVGFPTLLFLVGIYGIDRDLYEAAALDGANGWHQLLHLTIPLLKPVFALVLVLGLATVPAATESMLLLTNGAPQDASRTLGLYAYQTAFQLGDLRLGYASAMSLALGLASALVALLVFLALREETGSGTRRGWRRRVAGGAAATGS